MKDRLHFIAKSEKCEVEDAQLETILDVADGDMRRAVTTLQSVHALGRGVDDAAICEIVGMPPVAVVDRLYGALSAKNFESMQSIVEDVCLSGYSSQSLLAKLLPRFTESNDLTELGRARLAIRIAEAEKNMIDGADEFLQLMTVCSLAMQCFQQAKMANQ
jgi:replication factor C subunit 2/4